MKIGMISCNFYSRIYNYQVPTDFDWGSMVKQHHEEFGPSDLAELAAHIKGLGYDYLELWEPHATYKQLGRDEANKVRGLLVEQGLTPGAYCIGGWSAADIGIIERAYQFAVSLGVDVITGCINSEGSGKLLDTMDELGQKYGVRFAIENHPRPNFSSPAEVRQVLDDHSSYIGANIDTGIYYREGYDVLAAIDLLWDRVYHVHLKDATLEGAGSTAPGEGGVPLKQVFSLLTERGYKDMVSVEHEPHHDPTDDLRRGIEFIRGLV